MKIFFLHYLFILTTIVTIGQTNTPVDTLSLLFIGDIMGHAPQISSAYNDSTKEYSYEKNFKYIKSEISETDYTIANLEVTLAGKPYTGYPKFSSPDALAVACKNNGIDALVLANNHSCDRSKEGIIRTINILDSLGIKHTGTFKDSIHRDSINLILIEKNNIKIGLLNYTYGTNNQPFPAPTYVNLIDSNLIAYDINLAKNKNLDKLIVFIHWGTEYESEPNNSQIQIANYLFSLGVDIIIGSHPHVLQKMEYFKDTIQDNKRFIAYSLGNFISNQRTRKRDGGAMIEILIIKNENETYIGNLAYHLTWVYKNKTGNKTSYHILPCSKYENNSDFFTDKESFEKMKIFISDSRKLLQTVNLNVHEIKLK